LASISKLIFRAKKIESSQTVPRGVSPVSKQQSVTQGTESRRQNRYKLPAYLSLFACFLFRTPDLGEGAIKMTMETAISSEEFVFLVQPLQTDNPIKPAREHWRPQCWAPGHSPS
jgi:hypothetical protein